MEPTTYICESCNKEFPLGQDEEGDKEDGYVCAPCFALEEEALTYVLEEIIAKGYFVNRKPASST